MKKIYISIIVIIVISINFTKNFENKPEEFGLNNLLSLSLANAECRWPELLFGACNQRIESVQSTCTKITIRRTYFDMDGDVCGTGLFSGGMFTITSGYATGDYTDVESTESYQATRVNCPTDGNNNDCVGHNPC